MHDTLRRPPSAAALRGDDALARAAADAAAPRRRLLAALRDAHAEAKLRIAILDHASLPPPLAARLRTEAEAQQHRLELIFARLAERPGTGRLPGRASAAARPAAQDPRALAAEERRGAAEARALRDLAHLAGQHLAARLLDLTAEERAAAAAVLDQAAAADGAPQTTEARRAASATLHRLRG
jgi:hypothetical protein